MHRVSVFSRFLAVAGAALALQGCTLFSDVTRAIAEACGRPSVRTTTNADLRTNCSGDECSLWGAIALANTCNNGMVVELAEDGRYEIGRRPASSSAPGDVVFPAITGRFTIAGNGATIVRTVRDPFERFFLIQPRGDLTIADLTLQGGGSREPPGPPGSGNGGAIVNRGTLTIEEVRAIANSAGGSGGAVLNEGRMIVRGGIYAGNRAGGGCAGAGGGFLHNRPSGTVMLSNAVLQENRASCGGAIVNQGSLAVINSIFRSNMAGTGEDNTYAMGGALQNDNEDDNEPLATIVGSTFVGNRAMVAGAVGNTRGARALIHNSTVSTNHTYTPCPECEHRPRHRAGGVANFGTLTLRDVTLVANTCTGSTPCPGGLINGGRGAIVTVQNSIIADNVGADCAHDTSEMARFTVVGANLDSDSSCPAFALHASAGLGPLTDNGGPTVTHAVLPDSPAHDAGTTCFTRDQRGFTRARSDMDPCDIGAFEL